MDGLHGLLFLAGGMCLPMAVGILAGLAKIGIRALHVRVATGDWPSQSPEAKRMYLGEPRVPE